MNNVVKSTINPTVPRAVEKQQIFVFGDNSFDLLVSKGEWLEDVEYAKYDLVTHIKNEPDVPEVNRRRFLYVAKKASLGQEPSSTSDYWKELFEVDAVKYSTDYFEFDGNGKLVLKNPLDVDFEFSGELTVHELVLDGVTGDVATVINNLINGKVNRLGADSGWRVYGVKPDGTDIAVGFDINATARAIIQRDDSGRASIVAPTENSHIANKGYTDSKDADTLNSAENYADAGLALKVDKTDVNVNVTGDSVPRRDNSGRVKTANPSSEFDAVNKGSLESAIANNNENYIDENFPKLENDLIPIRYLPSYVDDVVEYDTFSDFPAIGESGRIYVAKDTNFTYRWSGTQYTQIGGGVGGGRWTYVGDEDEHTVPSELSIGGIFYERM